MTCDKCGANTLVLGNKSNNIGLNLCSDCKRELNELKKLDYEEYIYEIKKLGGKDKTVIIDENKNFLDKLKQIQKRS
jgi:hypothetical protein